MNTNIFRRIYIYAIGGLIGGGLGALIADFVYRKMEEDELFAPVDDEEKSDEALVEGGGEEIEYIVNGQVVSKEEYDAWLKTLTYGPRPPDLDQNEEVIVTSETMLIKKGKKVKSMDYSGVSKSHHEKKGSLDETAKKLLGDESLPEVMDTNLPYIISIEEFATGAPGHNKASLTYYEEDDTLTDPNEDVIPNPDEVLGDKALVSFGMKSGDPDVVYIRSRKHATDFEVVRLHKTYTEAVLGMVEKKRNKTRLIRQQTKKVPDATENENEDE
jgi:hypothetical protein